MVARTRFFEIACAWLSATTKEHFHRTGDRVSQLHVPLAMSPRQSRLRGTPGGGPQKVLPRTVPLYLAPARPKNRSWAVIGSVILNASSTYCTWFSDEPLKCKPPAASCTTPDMSLREFRKLWLFG